jgi:parallel beta-helix repeat protein
VDGQGQQVRGFISVGGASNVVIEGFEITGQKLAGIEIEGNSHGAVIRNNHIHDIHDPSTLFSHGFRGGQGTRGLRIEDNTIHSIGPGGESIGVFLIQTRDAVVDGNEIYLCRKEAIRDWQGLDNTIRGNRTFLNWTGIALNGSTGTTVLNNYSYSNVWGFNPKHVSSPRALSLWNLAQPRWSKIWHNTAYGNTSASIVVGGNLPTLDYLDVRNNVFANAGTAHVHDFPGLRGPNLVMDGNVYSEAQTSPTALYHTGWQDPHSPVITDIATYRGLLGFELKGQQAELSFADPAAGDLRYKGNLSAGVQLGDALGGQLGAGGFGAAGVTWTRLPMTPVAASPSPRWLRLSGASDGRQRTYWVSNPDQRSGWVQFDLGTVRTFNTIVLDMFGHLDPRNIKDYSFELSSDGTTYQTVLSGSNPDSMGSSYKYELPQSVSGRYLKLNILANFGGQGVIFSDLGVGMLTSTGS